MPAEAIGSAPPSRAEKDRILRRRAEELARPQPQPAAVADALDVLVFSLARTDYALATAFVREVQPLHSLTPLPGVPAFVLGMVNVRGQILAVLDLRPLLDLPACDLTDLGQLIILRHHEMEFGILADSIAGTRVLATAGLRAPVPPLRACRGAAADGLVLLDGDLLMADPRLHVEEEVAR